MRPKPSVVVFVSDLRRVGEFYRDLANMAVVVDDESVMVLETDGFQLVIHPLRGEPSAQRDGSPVRIREDSYLKVCLPVASIAAARAIASEKGGFIKPAQAEWEARGFRACDGHDPEGNIVQVRESASGAAE